MLKVKNDFENIRNSSPSSEYKWNKSLEREIEFREEWAKIYGNYLPGLIVGPSTSSNLAVFYLQKGMDDLARTFELDGTLSVGQAIYRSFS